MTKDEILDKTETAMRDALVMIRALRRTGEGLPENETEYSALSPKQKTLADEKEQERLDSLSETELQEELTGTLVHQRAAQVLKDNEKPEDDALAENLEQELERVT